MDKDLEQALEIAKRDLRQCYTGEGILAGRGHFQQYWARDCFFAVLGANALGDFEQAGKSFRLFLDLQDSSGQLPGLITKKLKPKYRPMVVSRPVDGNALFIGAVADYLGKSGDKALVEQNFKKIALAMEWLCGKDRDKDGLIEEGYLANWADTILKHGEVLYSNCCYYRALKDFAFLASELGVEMIAKEYEKRAETTRLALNLKFWENEYYLDWIGITAHNYFASAGNVLASAWGVATKNRAERIQEFIEGKGLDAVPMKTNAPAYPFWKVVPVLLPLKAYYYHNGFSWPWIGCMNAIALNRLGQGEKALALLKKIAWQINEYCACNEVFGKNNEPVDTFWLKSEKPFAWTAGLFIRALDDVIGLKKAAKKGREGAAGKPGMPPKAAGRARKKAVKKQKKPGKTAKKQGKPAKQ